MNSILSWLNISKNERRVGADAHTSVSCIWHNNRRDTTLYIDHPTLQSRQDRPSRQNHDEAKVKSRFPLGLIILSMYAHLA